MCKCTCTCIVHVCMYKCTCRCSKSSVFIFLCWKYMTLCIDSTLQCSLRKIWKRKATQVIKHVHVHCTYTHVRMYMCIVYISSTEGVSYRIRQRLHTYNTEPVADQVKEYLASSKVHVQCARHCTALEHVVQLGLRMTRCMYMYMYTCTCVLYISLMSRLPRMCASTYAST